MPGKAAAERLSERDCRLKQVGEPSGRDLVNCFNYPAPAQPFLLKLTERGKLERVAESVEFPPAPAVVSDRADLQAAPPGRR